MALDDRAFIELLYRVALGREGEEAGIAYYLHELAHVRGRDSVALSFSLSPENIARVGNKEYAAYVLSAADGVDLVAPLPPTQLVLAAEDDTGASHTDGITSRQTDLTIVGQAEAGATVIIFNAGVELARGLATGSGRFAIDIDLAEGTHALGVVVKDAFGNRSVAGSLTLQVVGGAPAAPNNLALDPASDTGISSSDGLTRETSLTITGSAATGLVVTLFDADGHALGSAVAAQGRFSIDVVLAPGVHQVFARALDSAGHQSGLSSALQIDVDVTPPVAASGLRLVSGDTGSSDSDGITFVTQGLVVTADAESGATVVLYDNDGVTELGRAVSVGGVARITLDLTEGVHLVSAVAIDAAGNSSGNSQPLKIEVDQTPPRAPAGILEWGSSDLADGVMNASEAASTTFHVTLPVTGRLPVAGDSVELRLDGGSSAVAKIHVISAADKAQGYVDFTLSRAELGADGAKTLEAHLTDIAGNVGASATWQFSLDTLAPGAPTVVDSSGATSDGLLDPYEGDTVYRVSLPQGAGRAAAGDTVELLLDGAPFAAVRRATLTLQNVSDGHVDFTVVRTDLGVDGTKAISARITDLAGNTGPASGSWEFVLDSAKPPVVTLAPGAASYVEGAVATTLDSAIGIADEDSPMLIGATVSITDGFEAGDQLVFAGGGAITGSFNTASGVLTLSGTASVADYQAALRSVQFVGTSQDPTASKTISWTVRDDKVASAAVSTTLAVTPVNDAPLITPGVPVMYTENAAAVPLMALAIVSDVDSADFSGGSLMVALVAGVVSDQLAIRHTGTGAGEIGVQGDSVTFGGVAIGTWSGGTGGASLVVTFTSDAATAAAVEALSRAITFSNSSDDPTWMPRTVIFTLVDGDGVAAGGADTGSAVVTVLVTPVNDAPVLTASTTSLAFTEGDPGTAIDPALTLVDPDDATMLGALVTISSGFQAGDSLAFTNQNGIVGTYDAGTGTLTLMGVATQAQYQAALRSITFSSTHDDPVATKTLQWVVRDGMASSNAVTRTIDITAVNDAPVIDLVAGGGVDTTALTATFTEDGAAVKVLADIQLIDPDSSNVAGATVTLTNAQAQDVLAVDGGTSGSLDGVSWTVVGNVVTFSGSATRASYEAALKLLTFANTSDHPVTTPRSFEVQVSDGAAAFSQSAVATATVNVVGVNDAPVFTSAATASVAEGDTAVLTLAATDAENDGITYTLSGGADAGLFTLTGNQLTFIGAPDYESPADAGANNVYDVQVSASDGTASTVQNIQVTVTNRAPSVPVDGDVAANTVSKDAPVGTLAHIDANATDPAGGAVTYSLVNDGQGRFAIDATTGVVTVAGAIVHDAVDESKNLVSITVRVTDAAGAYSDATFQVTIVPNTPPVATDNSGAATEPGGNANATPGTAATGNVITDAPADSDNEDAVGLLVVSAIGVGPEAAPGTAGTVGQPLQGLYGTLVISATGAYTYTVDPDNAVVGALQAGGATLTERFNYTVTDTGGGSDTATLSIIISGQNDAPQTADTSASGFEDQPSAAHTNPIQVVLTGTDIDGSVASFKVTALPGGGALYTDAALTTAVTVNTAIPATAGALTLYYQPAANANGVDTFTFAAIDDSGAQDSTDATATITVTAVNDAPSFTVGANQTVLEDAGAQTVAGFVTGIAAGPADESGQAVSFTVTHNNAALFSVAPAIDASGRLTYTAAANANGTAVVSVFVTDNGGTANGGADTSATQTFTINVTAVNDAPSFTVGANQVVAEDAGAQSVSNIVTGISAGPANEASQTTSFIVSNTRNDLFSVQPSIDATGRLTYTPAPNAFGTATVTVTLMDNGGTANGGVDTAAPQTFTIQLTPQQDAPVAVNETLAAINEDAGPVVVATAAGLLANDFDVDNFPASASNIGLSVSGVSNATNGTVSFNSATGNVTFTPNANYSGAASFDYTIADANGGTATAMASFTVNAVNDAPVNTLAGPTQLVVFSNTAKPLTGLSISDVDAGSATNITTTLAASDGATISVGNGVSGTNAGIAGGATVTTNGTGSVVLTGSVAQINLSLAGNNVSYASADNFTTPVNTPSTVTITTNDAGNTGIDPGLSGNATFEADVDVIQVGVIPQVWFIDSTPPASTSGPVGSQTNPFTSISQFNAASAGAGGPGANDYIYIESGTYTGDGINLKAGQTLLGADQPLSFNDPFGGPPIVVSAGGGARPTIAVTTAGDQGIALATDNVVRGVNITTSTGTVGVEDGGGTVNTLVMTGVQISGAGKAIDIDEGGNLSGVVFDSVGSTASTTQAIDLQGLSGTLTINGGSLGGATGATVNIDGVSSLSVSFNGVSMSQANNSALLNVGGTHTGVLTFNAASTLTVTHGTGLQFTNADGTYTFSGTTNLNGATQGDAGIDILSGSSGTFNFGVNTSINNSASGSAAFNLTNSNANVTYSGSIIDNNGRAVNIDNHDAGTVTFQTGAISASGAGAQGIAVLNSNAGTVVFNGQTTLSTAANAAVTLTNNTGGAVSFNAAGDGLDIVTTTGGGFSATGGGTVTVAGVGNSITSAGGIALNVVNTTIGAADLNFERISANGGANGIVLNSTGSTGGLNITGTGTAGSGGVIQNTTGAGISVTGAVDLNLSLMNLTNTAGHAIWLQNLGGVNTISKTTLENFNTVNTAALWWENTTSLNSTLTMDAVRVANQTNANGHSAVTVRTYSGGNLDFNVIDSNLADTFKSEYVNLYGSAINLSAGDTATDTFAVDLDVVVSDTTFRDAFVSGAAGGSGNLEMTAAGLSNLDFTIQNNTFSNLSRGSASGIVGIINLNTLGSGTVGTASNYSVIANNTITNLGTSASVAEAGYLGIRAAFDNTAAVQSFVGITGNTITDVWRQGVLVSSRDKAVVSAVIQNNVIGNAAIGAVGLSDRRAVEIETQATSVMTVSILNNAIRGAGTSDASAAVNLRAGSSDNLASTLNATVLGNTISNVNTGNTAGYFRAETTSSSSNHVMNLDLRNNTLPDPSKTYTLSNNGGTFKVEGPGTALVTPASLGATNSPGVGNITGTVTYNSGANVPEPVYNPLLAESMRVPGADDTREALTTEQLAGIVDAAVQRWALAGLSTSQLQVLEGVTFAVADLQGTHLGVAIEGGVVLIDSDAAGWGWFVDATPMDDVEFLSDMAAPSGHMDLLSVVVHELGHLLGFDDLHGASSAEALMHAYLRAGERRVPVADITDVIPPELLGVAPAATGGEAFL